MFWDVVYLSSFVQSAQPIGSWPLCVNTTFWSYHKLNSAKGWSYRCLSSIRCLAIIRRLCRSAFSSAFARVLSFLHLIMYRPHGTRRRSMLCRILHLACEVINLSFPCAFIVNRSAIAKLWERWTHCTWLCMTSNCLRCAVQCLSATYNDSND